MFKEWKRNQLEIFNGFYENHIVSDLRKKSLDTLIANLQKHGKVYIIRTPVDTQMKSLEDKFFPEYDEFIDISKKATNYAISLSGPDVNLGDLGGLIEEYVKSKEVEIDNKVFPLFTLKDLTGHNIAPYVIHKSKALPNTAIQYPIRMEEGDIFAVEPFVSTTDLCYYDDPVELYMINKNYTNMIKKLKKDELELFNKIFKKYFMLCFCKRWLNELKEFDINVFTKLINKNIIEEYKTIYVKSGNYVSQFEHNIYIKSNGIVKLTENKYY